MAETVRADFSALTGLLDDLERATGDVPRVMPIIAEAMVSEVLRVFEMEGAVGGEPKWEDLAESTKNRRRSSTSFKILQDTTVLVGSITPDHGDDYVEAFTNVPYAVYHISKAPRRVIPLRDFFAIDQEEFLAEASDIIVSVLLGRI
jgi:phage gpG-like protein